MPITPPVQTVPTPYTALDIITDAMIEVGMLAPGESADADSAQWGFRKLNYLLDYWAAQNIYVYSVGFQLFTLVPNLSPHTIGPGNGNSPATFQANQRPMVIPRDGCSIVLSNGGTDTDIPIPVEDDQWWASVSIKNLKSTLPTHLYYSPDWPNGNLFFWPIPTVANGVRLELWTLLNQFISINDPLGGPNMAASMPPAYRAALMLTLAETLQPGNRQQGNQQLSIMAAQARAAITQNNAQSPRMCTNAGMQVGNRNGRPDFNFLTGQPW